MRELLATRAQPLLRSSGDAADAVRAAEVAAACDLADDVLSCTQDLKGAVGRGASGGGGGGGGGGSGNANGGLSTAEVVRRRVLMCRADALVRITSREPQSRTSALLHAAYESRTVREFLLAAPAGGTGGGMGGGGGGGGAGTFADASWMAAGLDAAQSISEHGMALDGVEALLEQRLASACPALLRSGLLSPRTTNFQQRFEVGVNEVLLGAFGCALHLGHGLRQGVLHVSTRHLCFEAANHAQAFTRLPLSELTLVEPCRDPLFHLIPNAIKVSWSGGRDGARAEGGGGGSSAALAPSIVAGDASGSLVFASFAHRDEALALIRRAAEAEGGGSAPAADH